MGWLVSRERVRARSKFSICQGSPSDSGCAGSPLPGFVSRIQLSDGRLSRRYAPECIVSRRLTATGHRQLAVVRISNITVAAVQSPAEPPVAPGSAGARSPDGVD